MPSSRFAPHRFTIRRKVLLGFGTLLLIFGAIAVVSWRSTVIFMRNAVSVARAHEVLEIQEQAKRYLMEMESARRGYLVGADARFLAAFDEAHGQLRQKFSMLKAATRDVPEQTSRLELLYALLRDSVAADTAEIETRRELGAEAAVEVFKKHASEDRTEHIKRVLDDFAVEQRKTLAERAEFTNSVARATWLAIIAGTMLTFAALIVGASMILRDIAARRRAEEALAAEHNLLSSIMDTLPNHVFLKDAKGRFILNNAAHLRYLQVGEHETIEGRTVSDFFPDSVADKMLDDDRYVIETGQPILNREQLVHHHKRGENWLETSKVPLRDTDGRIVGLVGISSDISQRKAAEEQLLRFAKQLERSNAELANFASVASHDLQEPLRKIQAFGDRLKARCSAQLGEQGLDYLARMLNAAERMQVLIQDLLKLSRVTSRAQPFVPCELGQILREVLTDLEVAIDSQGAKLETGPLPTIDGDPLQLRQLFQNLISNALKFHKPEEKPFVQISSRSYDAPDASLAGAKVGDRVCEITVRDHGIGFEQRFADQIFVVFQRLHSRTEYEGTGIGLAVCRKITDRHGGRIVAHSSPGEGATFVVTLPVKQPATEIHEPQRSDADYDSDGR